MARKTPQAALELVSKPNPFLKWAGGKRGLLHEILPKVPDFTGRYIEAFLGAGAVLFAVDFKSALVNDFNEDLIEVYEVIKGQPEQLIKELKKHVNEKEHFLAVRSWDRLPNFSKRTPVERAARFIYLNKTGFNGLYRVNSKGYFNVPFAAQKNPDFIAEENIRKVSEYLKAVTFTSGDYRLATKKAKPGDFVYLDPPYDPISVTSSFVAYNTIGFDQSDQESLRDEVVRLTKLGVHVLLSNSDTKFIRGLYKDKDLFRIRSVEVRRAISAKTSSRGMIGEVLVDNFNAVEKGRR
jgi:DNA adenine methylase